LGALLALVFLSWLHRYASNASYRLLAFALAVAASIYILFASVPFDMKWMTIELLGFSVFLAIAWLGLNRSYWYLAAGWAVHVLWDIGLHSDNTTVFVPTWYPEFCMSFDIIVAAYIVLFRMRFASATH